MVGCANTSRAKVQACPPGPGDQVNGGNRIAAQSEEVIVDADAVHVEQLAPQGGELASHVGGRPPVRRSDRPAGGGKSRPVELAVRGERPPFQQHDLGRDHVLREQLACRGEIRRRRGIGDEPPVVFDDNRAREGSFHLAQLDPVAPHLHLVVDATDELEPRRRGAGGRGRRCGTAGRGGTGRARTARR